MSKKPNKTRVIRRSMRGLMAIESTRTFHKYLIDHALEQYAAIVGRHGKWGRLLSLCSEYNEPQFLPAYPFEQITLSGFGDQAVDVERSCNYDPRVSYECQNAECLTYDSRSYDVVICKEGLHHLARPFLGLYEMLRVCRRAVILIEPYRTFMGAILERLGYASVYERNYGRNIACRDNYVFRFSRPMLETALDSYYIDSGYQLDIHLGWMRWNLCGNRSKTIRHASVWCGRLASCLPFAPGNYMTAVIQPGRDLPPDPFAFENDFALPSAKGAQAADKAVAADLS